MQTPLRNREQVEESFSLYVDMWKPSFLYIVGNSHLPRVKEEVKGEAET